MVHIHVSTQQAFEEDVNIIFILQLRKLRYCEVKHSSEVTYLVNNTAEIQTGSM